MGSKTEIIFGCIPSSVKVTVIVPLFLLLSHTFLNFFFPNVLNPLQITLRPLDYQSTEDWTLKYVNGEVKVKSAGSPKLIDSWSEVEIAPVHTGWGDNMDSGIRLYKMTDKLYSELCDSEEIIRARLNEMGEVKMVSYDSALPHGGNVIGGGNLKRFTANLKERGLQPLDALSFNTDVVSAQNILDKLNQTNLFVSSFVSEFPDYVQSSPWHAAVAPSIAIQCHGAKLWNFMRPQGMAKYGGRGFNGAAMLRAFDEDEVQLVVKTFAGTIMSFPPYWAHTVLTYPGFSYLYTIRAAYSGSVFWNLIKRALRERLTLWYILPPWNGKSAFENSDQEASGADIYGNDINDMTREHLLGYLAHNEEVLDY